MCDSRLGASARARGGRRGHRRAGRGQLRRHSGSGQAGRSAGTGGRGAATGLAAASRSSLRMRITEATETGKAVPMRMTEAGDSMRISTETGEAVPMRMPMRITAAGEAVRITEPGEGDQSEGDQGSSVCAHGGKGKGIAGLLTERGGYHGGMEVSKFSRRRGRTTGMAEGRNESRTKKLFLF